MAALAASGCSTVIKRSSTTDDAGAIERAALADAAATAAWAPWPKPSSSSFAERLTGGEAGADGVSRDDAVEAYVAELKVMPDAQLALVKDANRHLGAARLLREAADDACDSPNPRLSDVALLEDAIASLRETRSIYIASLKKIDGEKYILDQLKDGFDEAIRKLGDVADEMAENAMKRRTENFAGPDTANFTAGSM